MVTIANPVIPNGHTNNGADAVAEPVAPAKRPFNFTMREQITIEDISGMPVGSFSTPQGQSAKVVYAMACVLLRRERPKAKSDDIANEVLDMTNEEINRIFEPYETELPNS